MTRAERAKGSVGAVVWEVAGDRVTWGFAVVWEVAGDRVTWGFAVVWEVSGDRVTWGFAVVWEVAGDRITWGFAVVWEVAGDRVMWGFAGHSKDSDFFLSEMGRALKQRLGTSLVVLWLRLWASSAGDMGSIPGRGTKVLFVARCSHKNKDLSDNVCPTGRVFVRYKQGNAYEIALWTGKLGSRIFPASCDYLGSQRAGIGWNPWRPGHPLFLWSSLYLRKLGDQVEPLGKVKDSSPQPCRPGNTWLWKELHGVFAILNGYKEQSWNRPRQLGPG